MLTDAGQSYADSARLNEVHGICPMHRMFRRRPERSIDEFVLILTQALVMLVTAPLPSGDENQNVYVFFFHITVHDSSPSPVPTATKAARCSLQRNIRRRML
jgi:hypothetical protein